MSYERARDLAWQVLLSNGISSLPVDVMKICRGERINVFTYSQGKSYIEAIGMTDELSEEDAFTTGNMIFYNEEKSPTRIRFSIAHELGHALLHSSGERNNGEGADKRDLEEEANVFASRLLAPLCVLQFLGVNSAEEIARICDIGYSSALIRFKRLCEMRKRNAERRRGGQHDTFLLSGLEREVLERFRDYIEKNKLR